MSLTELQIKTAKTKEKPYKLFDNSGLYLYIRPNGSKMWRIRYFFHDKENVFSVGAYPDISLKDARDELHKIKTQIKSGVNPNNQKKLIQIEERIKAVSNSFQSIALEWHVKNLRKWGEKQAQRHKMWIEEDILPSIGFMPISDVKPMHILHLVRKIEARNAFEVARRVLSDCSKIFRYAISTSRCEHDVTIGILDALVFVKRENFKCVNTSAFPALIRDLENTKCSDLTKLALRFIILTFVRTKELRFAEWREIDLIAKEWRIPGEKMKMKNPHIVPLSGQAIKVLEQIKSLGLDSGFIFPNEINAGKVMSENTMLFTLYETKVNGSDDETYRGKMTVHGFRQLASTILNENGFPADVIERQLAHIERNKVRRAYNHAQYLPQRKEMMQWWADYVSSLTHEW